MTNKVPISAKSPMAPPAPLRTAAEAVARAQEIARHCTGDKGGSADFIANRRADSGEAAAAPSSVPPP